MNKFLKIIGIFILVMFIIGGAGVFYMTRGLSDVKSIDIASIDPLHMEDGIYNGSFNKGRWRNKVEIEIKDGIIKNINFIEDVRFPMDEVKNSIIEMVLDKQSTNVDIVSGATVTSKAYLKSIEDALSPQ